MHERHGSGQQEEGQSSNCVQAGGTLDRCHCACTLVCMALNPSCSHEPWSATPFSGSRCAWSRSGRGKQHRRSATMACMLLRFPDKLVRQLTIVAALPLLLAPPSCQRALHAQRPVLLASLRTQLKILGTMAATFVSSTCPRCCCKRKQAIVTARHAHALLRHRCVERRNAEFHVSFGFQASACARGGTVQHTSCRPSSTVSDHKVSARALLMQ